VVLQQVLLQTEEYNGSTWTAGGNLGTARSSFGWMQELKQQDLLLVVTMEQVIQQLQKNTMELHGQQVEI
jgi:hypothetical protein